MRPVQMRCRTAQLGTRQEARARSGKKFNTGTYSLYRAAKSRITRQSMGGRKNLGPGCREALREEWMGEGRHVPRGRLEQGGRIPK